VAVTYFQIEYSSSLKNDFGEVNVTKKVIYWFFEATHIQPAAICPLLKPKGKIMVEKLFSEENIKK
jgi:hypothetical protein